MDGDVQTAAGFLLEIADGAAQLAARAPQLATLAPRASARRKRILRATLWEKTAQDPVDGSWVAIENEADGYCGSCWASDAEHREGVAMFLDERPPRFDAAA